MELAESLKCRAPILVSRVRNSARSFSMMYVLHSYESLCCSYVAYKIDYLNGNSHLH